MRGATRRYLFHHSNSPRALSRNPRKSYLSDIQVQHVVSSWAIGGGSPKDPNCETAHRVSVEIFRGADNASLKMTARCAAWMKWEFQFVKNFAYLCAGTIQPPPNTSPGPKDATKIGLR